MTTDSITPQQSDPTPDPACAQHQHASCLSRRRALVGLAGVGIGLPVLAACGSDSGSTAGSSSASDSAGAGSSASASGGTLTSTADIEVGSGKIFADENVVVTQPTEGEFKAFSATCTHQGCLVSSVEDGLIICECHGSEFSIEDGEPQSGPASSPLPAVEISVTGDEISVA